MISVISENQAGSALWFSLFIIMNGKPTVNMLGRTIEGVTTTWELIWNVVYDNDIVSMYGSFCFTDQHKGRICFTTSEETSLRRAHTHTGLSSLHSSVNLHISALNQIL